MEKRKSLELSEEPIKVSITARWESEASVAYALEKIVNWELNRGWEKKYRKLWVDLRERLVREALFGEGRFGGSS